MPITSESISRAPARKREYQLEKRDGTSVRCCVPGHFTVGQATHVLAEGAGYEPVNGEGMSMRLAAETTAGHRLLADETRFRELEEGLKLKLIPSLAPA